VKQVATEGWSQVILDGELFATDRLNETTTSVKGKPSQGDAALIAIGGLFSSSDGLHDGIPPHAGSRYRARRRLLLPGQHDELILYCGLYSSIVVTVR